MLTVSDKDPYKKFVAGHIMVTGRCNLRCYYCYYPPRAGAEPTVEQLDYIIEEFENLGESEIFYEISGGEPMLRPDWYPLMERFLGTGRDVVLNTNGTLIDEGNAARLADLYQQYGNQLYLSVSLDSHDPTIHNRIRGLYTQTVAGMKRLRDRKIPFRVSITLTRYNVGNLADTVRFVVDNLAQEVMIGILRPVFPMTEENKASILALDKIRAAYLEIEALREEKGFEFFHCLGKDGQPGCLAGFDRMAVDSNGDIYPCYALQHITLGNIFKNGLRGPMDTFRQRFKDKPEHDLLCERPQP